MFESLTALQLARLQFAITASYHFLFVPLTLGLSLLLAIMESVYVMTQKPIWKQMTQFWGLLFGINFAMGVATGITLEFQFGTNWAYYSHYVGDIFGSLLAIEGLMAFFLEATLIGLFFFGWKKLSKQAHLCVTWGLALATNFSALWILIANAWMQNPVGSTFNVDTLRMELTNFYDVFFNPVAQSKFVHTVSAGYVTGAVFVMAVSAWYLLQKRYVEFAKRSMTVAVSFGLASALSVIVLGDESGYTATQNQKMKIAAMEAVWNTEKAPADLLVFAIPDQQKRQNSFELKIPYLLGIIATRSFSTEIPGMNELEAQAITRIKSGQKAYQALQELRKNRTNQTAVEQFEKHKSDLGYGLLLKKYTLNVYQADEATIKKAAADTIPNVIPLFILFRVMVAAGFLMLAYFVIGFWYSIKRRFTEKSWFLKSSIAMLPLPWIAIMSGWMVAEHGRQPWAIEGVLPTFLASSNHDKSSLLFSLSLFVLFYTVLFIFDVMLLKKYIKTGPDIFETKD
ncbi:MAG: cytochrome ubiquinol oxidase subunit I [Pseudomonadota bacterium]|jgi:cytochrome d ubiquinol oxidase subunit I|nr:cytochrome ubiquinol oxidase subunit I [Alphaproteobacteria bacterium]